mgnify:CR=1 FL=1
MVPSSALRTALAKGPGMALAVAMVVTPLAAGAEPFRPPPAKEGFSYPDCFCTNRGQRVEVGDFSCLTIGDRSFLALCDMSQNSPAWRKVGEICPTASVKAFSPKPAG